MTRETPQAHAPTEGLSESEERDLYRRKRRNAVAFGWFLAIIVLITFIGSVIYLARVGENPFEERQEEYHQEQ